MGKQKKRLRRNSLNLKYIYKSSIVIGVFLYLLKPVNSCFYKSILLAFQWLTKLYKGLIQNAFTKKKVHPNNTRMDFFNYVILEITSQYLPLWFL
jgi:hypothetical protein